MDLDDSFTERLLQRNKVRKQYKSIKESENPEIIARRRHALVEDQQIMDQGMDDVTQDSPKRSYEEPKKDSPKRQCLEKCEGSPSRQWPPQQSRKQEYEKENTPVKEDSNESFVPFKSSFNVRGLAALKKTNGSDSTVSHRELTSETEVNNGRTYVFSTNSNELCTGRKTRLANLAANINQWEDNLHRPALSNYNEASQLPSNPPSNKFSTKFEAPSFFSSQSNFVSKPVPRSSPSKMGCIESESLPEKNTRKLGVWDEAIKATLEDEETIKSPLKSFKVIDDKREYVKKENSAEIEKPTNNSFKSKLKLFGNVQTSEDLNKSFEPSELPLSARKALFERGIQGEAGKLQEHSFEPKLSVAQRAALFENASQKSSVSKPMHNFMSKNITTPPNVSPCKPSKMANINVLNSPLKSLPTPEKQVPLERVKVASPALSASPIKKINADTRAVEQMLLARVNSKAEMKEPDGKTAKANTALVNYWEKLSASSKPENNDSENELPEKYQEVESAMSEDEQDGYESEIESKYESETESKYESETESKYESEIESKYERETESEYNYNTEITETEEDCSESDHESYSEEENVFKSPKGFPPSRQNYSPIVKNSPIKSPMAKKNAVSWERNYAEDSCDATSLSDGSSYAESAISTDVISTTDTHQTYGSGSSSTSSYGETQSLTESEENGNKMDAPLQYTVSFYRKQKQGTRTPPLQTIVRREQQSTPSNSKQTETIQEQIKLFQEEILKQQTIIGQTSQALNLCHATAEFSGSSEQVEGERLLLIATQKRQALLNEIQRLKTHGAEGSGVPDGTGTLTISDLQLPLKQEFLAAQLEGRINDAVHWFLCLIRYGPQVIVTQMVSTDEKVCNGALSFTNHIKLQNLPPDFSIVFEVYALQTKKERLPHDKKYHIKRDKSALRLTPKGKKSDNKLVAPSISSPGGPNAVRSPSFGVIGFTRFTIQSCNKKCFTLDKVPFSSPLEGVLRVKLHLHAEHKVMEKGFLTMFEDVSGFGAWHRRWCALNAQHLTYWKYPDDEQKKAPIGSIDLKECVTAQVKPVSRDICARPNTFQLVTIRPQSKGDKNTLISQCVNTLITTKHLLSADTKEERIVWCDKLNEALSTVRKWDPQAQRSVDFGGAIPNF